MNGKRQTLSLPLRKDADLDQIHIELEQGKGIITSNSKVGILIALYRFFHEFGVRYVRPGKEHEVYPSLTEADFFEKKSISKRPQVSSTEAYVSRVQTPMII